MKLFPLWRAFVAYFSNCPRVAFAIFGKMFFCRIDWVDCGFEKNYSALCLISLRFRSWAISFEKTNT